MVYTHLNVQTERVKCIAFHRRRPWFIFSCQNGYVELWDYVTKAPIYRFRAHNSPVRCIDFHPTQPLFVTGGDDATIKLWSLTNCKLIYVFTGHTDYVRSVFFHPHVHPYILSASDDNTARIWNWQSRQRVADLVGHRDLVMCAKWHPSDDLIVTASMDSTVRIWDISSIKNRGATGRIQQLAMQALALPHTIISSSVIGTGHGRGVNWVSWMPDAGNYLVSGSDDMKCKIWRLTRGTPTDRALIGPDALLYCSSTIEKHTGNVSMVEASMRNIIFTASVDGKLRAFSISRRSYIDGFTVQDLDPTVTMPTSAPIEQKVLRWWALREHPMNKLWAAGHDRGVCVFSMQLDDLTGTIENDTCYFITDHQLLSTNLQSVYANIHAKPTIKVEASLIKQCARDGAFGASVVIVEPTNLTVLGDPFPFIVSYWDGKNRFIVPYATAKDCSLSNYDPKNVIEIVGDVAKISSSHVAWLQAMEEGLSLIIAFLGTGGLTVTSSHPVPSTCRCVFPGRTEMEILIASSTSLMTYRIEGISTHQIPVLVKSVSVPQLILHTYYSKDRKYLAVTGTSFVAIISMDTFTINVSHMGQTSINLGVWALLGRDFEESEERPANAFVYSTLTHICYILPFPLQSPSGAPLTFSKPITGVLTSLNRPIYILSVKGQIAIYLDRYDGLSSLDFDSRIVGLIQAVATNRIKDIPVLIARIQNTSSTIGVSLCKRLLDMNRPDLALAVLPKEELKIREELALNLGLLDHTNYDQKRQGDDYQLWLRVFAESLAQGQGLIARDALIKANRIDLLGFLVSLYNTTLKDSLTKVEYDRLFTSLNVQQCFNAALLSNDKELFHSTLLRAGLTVPAKIFASANSLTEMAKEIRTPPASKVAKQISVGRKLKVPLRNGELRNYKTTSLTSSYEDLMKEISLAAEKEGPIEGETYHGWDSDEDDDDYALPPSKSLLPTMYEHNPAMQEDSSTHNDRQKTITAPSHGTNSVMKHPLLGSKQDQLDFLAENGITSQDALSILKPYIDRLCTHNKKLQEVTPMEGLPFTVSIADTLVNVDTVSGIQKEFRVIMDKVDAGAFADAVGPLRTLLQRTIFARTCAGGNDHDDLSVIATNIIIYVASLSCELERRVNEKSLSSERICELYVLFALQNMKTKHALLALRLAITGTKKHGAYTHCRQLAQRFIQLSRLPEAQNLDICQIYLQKAKKLAAIEDDDLIQLSFSAADQNTANLCTVSYKNIVGKHCICSACKACACSQYFKETCPVCELGTFLRT